MNQILVISTAKIGENQVQTVNARDLHGFLESGKDFSNWIKDRVESYGFSENSDFVCSPNLASDGRGGQNRIDYHLSLDMAKEISMVERNAKGKEARQYFISCEKQAKEAFAAKIDVNPRDNQFNLILDAIVRLIDGGRTQADAVGVVREAYGVFNGSSPVVAPVPAAAPIAIRSMYRKLAAPPKPKPSTVGYHTLERLAKIKGLRVEQVNQLLCGNRLQVPLHDGSFSITSKGNKKSMKVDNVILWHETSFS